MLKRIVDFEVAPPPTRAQRGLVALGMSAIIHACLILLVLYGIPVTSGAPVAAAGVPAAQRIDLQAPMEVPTSLPRNPQPEQEQARRTPPPPAQQVELGPDSKKPDARAMEAAAKQQPVPDHADAAATPKPAEMPPAPPAEQPKPVEPQPAAPQRIEGPRPGDFANAGRMPMPTTSPWGPPKLDAAPGAASNEAAVPSASAMGRAGLTNSDPQRWENSFDAETSGRCTEIPDLGKNADGSPVLASVIGRVLDTDGRTPLAGAHLQILGTAFNTFSDNNGEYRLEFDPRMLAKCRKQIVDVVAPGYARQSLTLSIGRRIRSDDVVLRHGR